MDAAGAERGRKGDLASSSSLSPLGAALTTPLLPPSPSGSGLILPSPPPPAAAALVLALPAASRAPAAPCLAGAMDGGGEALLVRRSKGKKRPPAGRESGGGGGGGGHRFRELLRDYRDLLEETEAKRNMLARANRTKLGLIAEVKFLRRRYKSLVKDDESRQYRLKKKARKTRALEGSNEASAFADHGVAAEMPSTSKHTSFDLNQDTVMNNEGVDRQGHLGHSELENSDQAGVDEDMLATDVKLSVCRDTGNSPASDDKRTIPWQDRLALKA
ncbi:hypothetical protein ACP70R_006857 [Stipagrostis hirtigluma subsp. patula]